MDYQKITELLTKLVLLSRQESVHPVRRSAAADAAYLYSELIDRDVDSMHYKQIKSDFINAINNLKYDSREYIKALETKKDKQWNLSIKITVPVHSENKQVVQWVEPYHFLAPIQKSGQQCGFLMGSSKWWLSQTESKHVKNLKN